MTVTPIAATAQPPHAETRRAAALDLLLSRQSAGQLQGPAPSDEELDLIFQAGLRAPDHGRLRPWRFLVIRGAARGAFADAVAAGLKLRNPDASEALLLRQRARILDAPLQIALGARITSDHPVPEIEQLLSVGAAAMNMLNAIHALGYGGMWVTGGSTYDPKVLDALGLRAPDRLVGCLMVGTPKNPRRSADRPAVCDHVREWTGAPDPAGIAPA